MSTTIKLKKSGATGNTPTSGELELGELALNYADGVLYYKDASNNIKQISGVAANTFETIIANGTLIIADANNDILTLNPGSGIDISGDGLNDTITIAVRTNDTFISNSTITVATSNVANALYNIITDAYDQANTGYDQANSAFGAANNRVLKSGDTMTGALNIACTAVSISNSTGALVVDGGVGITGNTFSAGKLTFGDSLNHPNIANVLNLSSTSGDLAYRPLNLIDTASTIKVVRLGSSDPGLEFQKWDALLSTRSAYIDMVAGFAANSFSIRNRNGSTNYLLHIDSNGYFAIGGSSTVPEPNANLHVFGNAIITTGIETTSIDATTINSSTFLTSTGANVYLTAINAYGQANAAYLQANTARSDANATFATVNTTFGTVNTAITNAHNQANVARNTANSAYGQANTAITIGQNAYAQANLAYTAANNSNLLSGGTIGGTLNISGNLIVTGNTFNVGIGTSNPTSNLHVIGTANITSNLIVGGAITENTNGTFYNVVTQVDVGTAPNQIPLNQYLGALAYQENSLVYIYANNSSSVLTQNINFVNTSTIFINIAADGSNANVEFNSHINDTYEAAGNTTAAATANIANGLYSIATSAYDAANTKFEASGGTISGDVTVTGNLIVSGNTTTLNVETLQVEDNEIVLNFGANTATLNAGIIVNRGSEANVFVRWNEDANTWGWSDDGNTFYSFDTALTAYGQANLAYDQANTAYGQANDAYAAANTANSNALDAYAQANSAYNRANTAANTTSIWLNDALVTSQSNLNFGDTATANVNVAANVPFFAYGKVSVDVNVSAIAANTIMSNTFVSKSGDTMTGNLNVAATVITQNAQISSNLTFIGNTRNYAIWAGDTGTPISDARLNFTSLSGHGRYWFDNYSGAGGGTGFSVAEAGIERAYFGTSANNFSFTVYEPYNLRFASSNGVSETTIIYANSNTFNVGIGTTSPYKKLEIAGDMQLDSSNANIWIKSGGANTNGFINWTFNTDNTVYNKVGIDYDTRGTTGFHIDAGYPLTLDGVTRINFALSGSTQGVWDSTGLGIGTTSPTTAFQIVSDKNAISNLNLPSNYFIHLRNPQTDLNEGVGLAFSLSTDANLVGASIYHIREGSNSLGPLVFATKDSSNIIAERVRIAANGNVGIGTTSPTSRLHVVGTANITSNLVVGGAITENTNGTFYNVVTQVDVGTAPNQIPLNQYLGSLSYQDSDSVSLGQLSVLENIAVTGNVSAMNFDSTSDLNLKEAIIEIPDPINTLQRLHGVSFQWKSNKARTYGVIAQELEKVLPELVNTDSNGLKTVSYNGIIALLIEAVKSLSAELNKTRE